MITEVHISRAFDQFHEAARTGTSFSDQCELVGVDVTAAMKLIDVLIQTVDGDIEASTTMAFFMGILAQRKSQLESIDGGKSGT